MTGPLLEARDIRKTFVGIEALKGVSFDLLPGEVHALVGENGAGKSTLIKIITGAVEPDEGRIAVCGRHVERNSPALGRSLGIAAIYQQPLLFPHLTVAENIALALEGDGAWRRIDWKGRRARAFSLLARVGADIEPDREIHTLSMPEQQLVEIAKAIGSDAKILVMDEPTAALTDREVERLFEAIRGLRAHGAGVVYISHRLEEIAGIADRITVLRDGEALGTWAARELDRPTLIEKMAGRPISAVFPRRNVARGAVALDLRSVSSKQAGIRDVSLSVKEGEIVGLAGLVGSGRTQLAETIFGLTPADSGEVLLFGEPVTITSPRIAIKHGIGYLPEDRRAHGVVLEMSLFANTSLAALDRVSRLGFVFEKEEHDLARRYIGELRIKTPSADVAAGTLSGGSQQKVALARWLATGPKVLILDEPTQGVDVASKAEIHALMTDLAAQGMAILMISSELLEILGMSDRIVVMREGEIAGVLSREQATQQRILSLALGHPIPEEPSIVSQSSR
jgi:rhamnose transport system ATP-binding protein